MKPINKETEKQMYSSRRSKHRHSSRPHKSTKQSVRQSCECRTRNSQNQSRLPCLRFSCIGQIPQTAFQQQRNRRVTDLGCLMAMVLALGQVLVPALLALGWFELCTAMPCTSASASQRASCLHHVNALRVFDRLGACGAAEYESRQAEGSLLLVAFLVPLRVTMTTEGRYVETRLTTNG